MKSIIFSLVLLSVSMLTSGQSANRQKAASSQEKEVLAVVNRMLEGMRKTDSTLIRSAIHPKAGLLSVVVKDGNPVLRVDEVNTFIKAAGTKHEGIWDERLFNTEVKIEGGLASVWTNYTFYLSDKVSHCGVNLFQLIRSPSGWQIIQLTDTRQKDGCQDIRKR